MDTACPACSPTLPLPALPPPAPPLPALPAHLPCSPALLWVLSVDHGSVSSRRVDSVEQSGVTLARSMPAASQVERALFSKNIARYDGADKSPKAHQ